MKLLVTMAQNAHDTPAMRQYRQFKEQSPGCVLFFRMGDFYELFYDDAKLAHRVLGLTLTQRTAGIDMAGIPYHQLDTYLQRMIKAGYRVAICDQIEDAAEAKGIVKRDITRLVTPGTLTDESLLDEAHENVLAALAKIAPEQYALASVELSTGDFLLSRVEADDLRHELARRRPSELLIAETADGEVPTHYQQLAETLNIAMTMRPGWPFRPTEAHELLCKQFSVNTLSGFGLDEQDPMLGAAGAVVHYLLETQRVKDGRLIHLRPPKLQRESSYVLIDDVSMRSLEIERTVRSGTTDGSLLQALQKACTAMGKRLLRHWLCYPLRDRQQILQRQNVVQWLVDHPEDHQRMTDALKNIQDVHRLVGRLAIGRSNPRDMLALGRSINDAPDWLDNLAERPPLQPWFDPMQAVAGELIELGEKITATMVDDPPAHLRDGGAIRTGIDPDLDEARSLQTDSNTWLADYQKQMIEKTQLNNLKVGYNKVFGYYLEVSRAQSDKVPPEFTRKQTLKNAERYITEPLKDFENKVLGAQQRALAREQQLFADLCALAIESIEQMQQYAQLIAELDVLCGFAAQAIRRRYVRPELVDEPILEITDGRHPVLEQSLGHDFVPNDTTLGGVRQASLALITGPNMAGKSTYIRQVALLSLMAHAGSFVPAASAKIGMVDRIFTRIGASDEIHLGQSTFMVEMTETANICHHATTQSLVILDEIGRGTSTLDGLSLAWAIAEHLSDVRCRGLFATHYHELTRLAEEKSQICNLHVQVREWAEEVVFLHRIASGATDRSYGIHVAKIAGLPEQVVGRARDVLNDFEQSHEVAQRWTAGDAKDNGGDHQPGLFDTPQRQMQEKQMQVIRMLRELDMKNLTPLQAFDVLRQWREQLKDDES